MSKPFIVHEGQVYINQALVAEQLASYRIGVITGEASAMIPQPKSDPWPGTDDAEALLGWLARQISERNLSKSIK